MKVKTNNKALAVEVLSAQGLIGEDTFIEEITITGRGSLKHAMNNYDATVVVNKVEFVLFRDENFINIRIKKIDFSNLKKIEFELI